MNNHKDILEGLFKQLPTEQLPADFRSAMMQRIMKESIRAKKWEEIWHWVALILASGAMLGLGIFVIRSLELPKIVLTLSERAAIPFYMYLVALVVILLFGDYFIRKKYREKHKEE